MIWLGQWLTIRAAALADVGLLPARSRRRLQWCQRNARHIEFSCAIVAVGVACSQLGSAL
jgi:hypothetical protein